MIVHPVLSARRQPGGRALLLAALLIALALPSASAAAQGVPRGAADPWRAPRVLKWSLLAVSAGLGLWAYGESRQADDAYARLGRLCRSPDGAAGCSLANGRYADPRAEALYDEATGGDRRARVGLLAGQAALLGSATFFIVDLGRGGPPDNIPYHPPAGGARLRVGLRLPTP